MKKHYKPKTKIIASIVAFILIGSIFTNYINKEDTEPAIPVNAPPDTPISTPLQDETVLTKMTLAEVAEKK